MTLFDIYNPKDPFEVQDLIYIKDAIKHYGDLLYERHYMMHFSASAMIFNKDFSKTLMIYHKLYDSWGWTGGHLDGNKDFKAVALKEAKEETGLDNFKFLTEEPMSIEVLPVWFHVKKNQAISSHLHLNASYLLIADELDTLSVNEEETNGCKWIPIEEITSFVSEPEMMPIYEKLIKRGRDFEKNHTL